MPNDILPQCIWACEFHIRALETSTVKQLKHTGALLPHQSANVQYTLVSFGSTSENSNDIESVQPATNTAYENDGILSVSSFEDSLVLKNAHLHSSS